MTFEATKMKQQRASKVLVLALTLPVVFGGLAGAAIGQEEEQIFKGEETVPDPELAKQRGAFIGDGGLKVSLGIQREVAVNGAVVTRQSLSVPDLLGLAGTGSGATLSGPALAVVQNGPGNFANLDSARNFGTVIQNSLNNQTIQGITRIDATVTNMELVRSMNTASSVSQELGRSAR
jgi:hypothetical protein